MRVWKSSRGKGEKKILDATPPPVLRAPVTTKEKVHPTRAEVIAITSELTDQGFTSQWNLRMGLDQFVSFWRHQNGAILLLHWFRDTGAVEVYRPILSDTLEELFNEIENEVMKKETP